MWINVDFAVSVKAGKLYTQSLTTIYHKSGKMHWVSSVHTIIFDGTLAELAEFIPHGDYHFGSLSVCFLLFSKQAQQQGLWEEGQYGSLPVSVPDRLSQETTDLVQGSSSA
jgi:hypothetical protein